ncbi:hypothetical protein KAR91_19705 [Candidatus Pacearchaeota archaeon]|nr:hypothetical protein [Candidatus Pacearchaeota archaeon]
MSCEACTQIQTENRDGNKMVFIRIGNGNVMVGACDRHFNELRQMMGIDVNLDESVYRMNLGKQ